MFIAIGKRLEDKEEGFTLIELLVVVIIIGILAAIAIPTFLRQRERGWEADAQSALRNAAVAAESCATQNDGLYTNCVTNAQLTAEGFNLSAGWTYGTHFTAAAQDSGTAYNMTARHPNGGDQFTLNSTNGQITRVTAP